MNELLRVNSSDAEVQRRGRNVIILSILMVLVMVLFIVLAAGTTVFTSVLVAASVNFAVHTTTFWLARQGRPGVGAMLMLGSAILATLVVGFTIPSLELIFMTIIPVLLAIATVRPIGVLLTGLIMGLVLALLLFSNPWGITPIIVRNSGGPAVVLLGFTTLVGLLNSTSIVRFFSELQRSQTDLKHTATLLEQSNVVLEERVRERTIELEQALGLQRAQAEELSQALHAQKQLAAVLSEMALPIIPIRDDVLVVPLVGALDTQRGQDMLSRVLHAVEDSNARAVILDVTGVPVIDTYIGRIFISTADALAMLGARTLLVGISPEVAQALVGLGVSLDGLETRATLQQGLEVLLTGGVGERRVTRI
ncbi:STAS domain-containing protein [Candidatus Gracilibacteria bacterium]|nr:STAS domain-containing protein [Candidatus Gracilibacteria bacterium]